MFDLGFGEMRQSTSVSGDLLMRLRTNGARLELNAPQRYGNQVLRPYMYGFTEGVANFLMGKGDTLDEAIRRKDVLNSEMTASIVRPDPVGTTLTMDGFNECWTFVLYLYIPNNVHSGILAAEGSKLLIFRGHCGDEPIDPNSLYMSTPVINRNCKLFVHSREILRDNPKNISAFGMLGSTDVCGTVDVIDGCLNTCSKDKELYLIQPSDVLENYSLSGLASASAPGLCSISNDRKTVPTDLKDPGLHLRNILQGIDATNSEIASAEFAPHGSDSFTGALSAATDTTMYKQSIVNQLSMLNGQGGVEQGIEIRNVVTIGDIERGYPNMDVLPIRRDIPMMDNIIPQDIPSKRVAYSSMAASAISSIAAGCGLMSIAFMYTSYNPSKRGQLITSDYRVKEDMCTLTYPPSNPEQYATTLKAAVQTFMMKIRNDLEPFIKYVCGDFMMTAMYSLDTETRVDLQFLDDSATTNGGAGWFETPSRLSSLSSTSVGTKENFDSNGHSLNQFIMQVQGRTQKGALGLTAFDRPVIHNSQDDSPADSVLAGLFNPIS